MSQTMDLSRASCLVVDVIKSHIGSMAAVIKDRVKGNGGKIRQALSKGLQDAIERYRKIT